MTTYYHGTTQAGLDAILAGQSKAAGPWTCCDQDGMTYLWDAAAMVEGEDMDDMTGVIRMAFESAQIQAAVKGEDTTLYVLEVCLDAGDVEPDYSCENMHYAVTTSEARITLQSIGRVYRCEFSKWAAPFVLAGLVGREHFADSSVEDERLVTLAETLNKQGVFRDELYDFDWDEHHLA